EKVHHKPQHKQALNTERTKEPFPRNAKSSSCSHNPFHNPAASCQCETVLIICSAKADRLLIFRTWPNTEKRNLREDGVLRAVTSKWTHFFMQ
ncbi:Protein STE50, partial [Clarias magur]